MSEERDIERVRFLPLAITRVDERHGCVGAVREDGGWIRPEPTYLADVEAPDSPYSYDRWTVAEVTPSSSEDARPEDRDLAPGAAPRADEPLPVAERPSFLARHLDADADSAFAEERSLGLVEVDLDRFYVRRSTGGRFFLRAEFHDGAGERHDWIVPDITFGDRLWPHVDEGILDPRVAESLADTLADARVYFCLGLTHPNHRFPGRFRGCHPLVVGVHTVPDYRLRPLTP